MQTNTTVREAAKNAGIPLWRVATEIGISEATITRWLRLPLSHEREQKIMDAIKAVKEANENV